MIRCVKASGQRFGLNLMVGTLLGADTAKIRNYRLDENPSYGKQSKLGQPLLREVIRALLEQGYLRQTEDRYSLLKLTENSEVLLYSEEPFWISYRRKRRENPRWKKSASAAELTEKTGAFEELRKLRAELARKRGVPPYIVASDKTLADLCGKMPHTREELLEVNGMGEKKVQMYGEAFLAKVGGCRRR